MVLGRLRPPGLRGRRPALRIRSFGRRRRANDDLSPSGHADYRAAVVCRIGARRHVWGAAGEHKSRSLRLAWLRPFSNDDLAHSLYPEVDNARLEFVGHTIEQIDA